MVRKKRALHLSAFRLIGPRLGPVTARVLKRDFYLAVATRRTRKGPSIIMLCRLVSPPQSSKVSALYNGPIPRLRSLLCLAQCTFPLLAGVVLSPLLSKDGVGNFEVAIRCTSVADCIPSTIKLLLHRGLADRAKERPGHQWPATVVEATLRHKARSWVAGISYTICEGIMRRRRAQILAPTPRRGKVD